MNVFYLIPFFEKSVLKEVRIWYLHNNLAILMIQKVQNKGST